MDADSYLPVFAMDYEIVRLNLANIVLKKMTDTVAVVKTESDSFSDVQIEQRTRLKYPKFDDEGHLVYSFFGVSGGNRQITEKRFLLKGNILITLTLSDFEGTFSNKALDDVEASLTFVTPARSPKTS